MSSVANVKSNPWAKKAAALAAAAPIPAAQHFGGIRAPEQAQAKALELIAWVGERQRTYEMYLKIDYSFFMDAPATQAEPDENPLPNPELELRQKLIDCFAMTLQERVPVNMSVILNLTRLAEGRCKPGMYRSPQIIIGEVPKGHDPKTFLLKNIPANQFFIARDGGICSLDRQKRPKSLARSVTQWREPGTLPKPDANAAAAAAAPAPAPAAAPALDMSFFLPMAAPIPRPMPAPVSKGSGHAKKG